MIHDLILFTGLLVMWCLGVFIVSRETGLSKLTKSVIVKPILSCITCMASVHGVLIFAFLIKTELIKFDWAILILGCMISAFVQSFIWSVYEYFLQYSIYIKRINGSDDSS